GLPCRGGAPGRAKGRDRRQASVRCALVSGLAPLSPRRDRASPRFHLPARVRALPPEREWSAKPYPADALPFGMKYCLRKLREPAINENSCGRRSRLNSRGFARRPKETHARCGHIGGLKLRSDDGGRREPSGY